MILIIHIVAMLHYPDVCSKAQAEIDRVIGDRIPTIDDQDILPFLSAIILECLRWGCPATIGAPHRLMEDDTYNDFFIPTGTTVIANVW